MPVGGADWYKEQPTNRNFLNPIGFILKLEKFEGTDFFCQSANVPDINMPLGGADWYKEQPTNRNFLNPIGFILELEKFEGVDFFCQSANVPDINMPCLLYTSPSPRDVSLSRMPSSA